jgi:hypothetical protein
VPDGPINKMADLQGTKFIRLFGFDMRVVGVHTPRCGCLYLCVKQHQY